MGVLMHTYRNYLNQRLLKIGRGIQTEENLPDDVVEIPVECCVANDQQLITEIFGKKLYPEHYTEYTDKAILATKNVDTLKLNMKISNRLESSKEHTYYSADYS